MKISCRILLLPFCIMMVVQGMAQDISEIFDDIVLRVDTSEFSFSYDFKVVFDYFYLLTKTCFP
jgi:hypothetical protein